MDRRTLGRIFDRFMTPADTGTSGDEWLRTDAVRWEPPYYAIGRPLRHDAADMDDASQCDDQAGRYAFETIFTSPDVPGAEITVCTYVVYMENEATYWVGVRYTYTTPAAPGWSYVMWDHDPHERPYPGHQQAIDGARDLARAIGLTPVWARAMLPGIFDWDGRRFDVTIHAAGEES